MVRDDGTAERSVLWSERFAGDDFHETGDCGEGDKTAAVGPETIRSMPLVEIGRRSAGTYDDVATTSLYPAHHLTM